MGWSGRTAHIARRIARLQAKIARAQGKIAKLQTTGSFRHGSRSFHPAYTNWAGGRLLRGLVWLGLWASEHADRWFRGHDDRASQWISPQVVPPQEQETVHPHGRTFWTFGRRTR